MKALETIDIPLFSRTISSILSEIGIEALYHGNVDDADAELAKTTILRLMQRSANNMGGLPKKKHPAQFVMKMPPSMTETLIIPNKDPTDPNTAVEVYFQIGKDNTTERVLTDLLTEIMYEPLFDQIRTKDQFGYHVSCDSRWTNGVLGMHFQVVTSSKSAQDAADRVEKFLRDFRTVLHEMTSEAFMEHLVGLAKQKLDMFDSLSDETNHLWSEIRDGRYCWQVDREEVLCLRTMTKEQVLAAYDKWLYPDTKSGRRMLVIQVISSCEGPASQGRPDVAPEAIGDFIDGCVENFHKQCKHQTFGKIY